jgi:cytochrome bd-type quinol oxidase subunit 2
MKKSYLIRGLVSTLMFLFNASLIANVADALEEGFVLYSLFFVIINFSIIIFSYLDKHISTESFNLRTLMAGVLNVLLCAIICIVAIRLNDSWTMWALIFSCITTAILMFDFEGRDS